MTESAGPGLRERLLPHPVLTLVLILVWLLLVNGASPGHIVLGTLLGWLIPLFTRRYWPEPVRMRHPLTLLRFVATVLYDILVANLTVAWTILFRSRRLKPGLAVF